MIMTTSKLNDQRPNKQPPPPAPAPSGMAHYYKMAWAVAFNKLSKNQQEILLVDLQTSGSEYRVNSFVKEVISLAEQMHDLKS